MEEAGVDYRMLIMPDHPTPIKIRTHTDDPVPYLLYDSRVTKNNPYSYNEFDAKNSGNLILKGYTIIDRLFKNPE